MDDEIDDFGDLYADLDDCPSIPGIHNLSIGDEAKIDSKPAEAESMVEELCSQPGSLTAAAEEEQTATAEEEEEEEEALLAEDQSSSDSEDDLRILLNEGDCSEFLSSQRVNSGSDEEDEGDRPSKDRRRASDGGLLHSEMGRVPAVKRHGWYVGSHLAVYARNVKASTSVGREWDRQQILQAEGSTFCNVSTSTMGQNGFGFSVPKNRTIFDVSIEAFERKPWRQQGVDLTDYFNFGLDEEGWRSYWESLNHYRQQVPISMGFHNCESSRLNQGEISSSAIKNEEKGGRDFEMPKGRAIQVEDGEGERLPSVDIRRSRYRDSNVVIQITTEDSMDDASLLSKKEVEHLKTQESRDVFLHKSQNKINDRLLSSNCEDQGFGKKARPVEPHHSEENEFFSVGTKEEAKAICKKGVGMNPSRIDGSNVKAEATFGDHHVHVSNSSDIENHSEASNNAISLEKVSNSADDVSTGSGIQLKESEKSHNYIPNNSRCDATNTDENDPECTDNYNRRQSCGTRVQHLEEPNVPRDDELIHSRDYRERRNDAGHVEARCGTRDRRYIYDSDVARHSSSCKEFYKPVFYRSRRYAKKDVSDNSYFRFPCKNGNQSKYLERNPGKSEFLFSQRDSVGDDGIEQRERYFHTRDNSVWAMRDATCEDLNPVTSEHHLPSREKVSRFWHIDKSKDCWRRMEAVYDERIKENRYTEGFLHEIHGGCITHTSEKEKILDYKFSRPVLHRSRDLMNLEEDSCLDLVRPSRYGTKDSNNQKDFNHKQLVSRTCRETNIACEGSRHDVSRRDVSPTENSLPVSRRSSKRYVYHREHPDTEKIPSKSRKDGCFVPSNKDPRYLYKRNCLDFEDDDRAARESVVYNESSASSEKRKYNRLAKPRLHIDDEVSATHNKKWSYLSHPKVCASLERSSRHNSFVNHDIGGQIFFDNHYDIKRTETEQSAKFHCRDRISSVSDGFGKGVHEPASMGCREAVTFHLNDWKRKLPRTCSKVKGESDSNRDTECVKDKLINGSSNIEGLCKRKEVSFCKLKTEASCVSQSRLTKDKLEEAKSDHCNDHVLKSCHDSHPNAWKHEDEELEEGELLEEPDSEEVIPDREKLNVEKVAYRGIESSGSNSVEENPFQSEDFARSSQIIGGYDNSRIIQALEKMEKRKERFKESIALKEDHKKSLNSQLSIAVVTDEVKQLRPSRKRRWGGG